MLPLWKNEEFHSFPRLFLCVCVWELGERGFHSSNSHKSTFVRHTKTHTKEKSGTCVMSVLSSSEGWRLQGGDGSTGWVWSVPSVFPIFVVVVSSLRQHVRRVQTHCDRRTFISVRKHSKCSSGLVSARGCQCEQTFSDGWSGSVLDKNKVSFKDVLYIFNPKIHIL